MKEQPPRRQVGARVRTFHKLSNKKGHLMVSFFVGGEGEIRTLAPIARPTPLAGAPLHRLEYFSVFAEQKVL